MPITVKVKGDLLDELDETLKLELLNNNDVVVRSATGTISNDDNNSKLSISDATADEPGTMKFTVTLAPASGREVKVNWATADGTATAPGDYTRRQRRTDLRARRDHEDDRRRRPGDTTNEENETLKVILSSPIGVPPANLVDGQGDGTIVDKNAPPSLSISDTTTREGVGANFTVTLAGTTLRTVTVRFNTADGTATGRLGLLRSCRLAHVRAGREDEDDHRHGARRRGRRVRRGVLRHPWRPVNATITKTRGVASIEASDQVSTPTTATPGTTPPTGTPPTPNATPKQLVPRMILGPRTVWSAQRAREDAGHLPEGLADRVRRHRRARARRQAAAEARQEDVHGQEGRQGLRVDQADARGL